MIGVASMVGCRGQGAGLAARLGRGKANMQLRKPLLTATLVALPLAAQAQQAVPVTGLYIAAGAGVNIMQNEPVTSVTYLGTTQSVSGVDLQPKVGAVGVVSLGWGFGNGLRAEIEGDYRYNGFSKITGPGGVSFGGAVGNAFEQKYGPMVNVLYDFT